MFSPSLPTQLLQKEIALCWIRRDLRLHDHHALWKALNENKKVLLFFIFDTNILRPLPKKDVRVAFIHQQLHSINEKLKKRGSALLVLHGDPLSLFQHLLKETTLTAVYANEDYEPLAIQRDQAIKKLLQQHRIPFYLLKDQVIFSPKEVLKDNHKPYTVYTPYMKRWKAQYQPTFSQPFEIEKQIQNLIQLPELPLPTLQELGFEPTEVAYPPARIEPELLKQYHQYRDQLGRTATSQLGVHLRFGTLSIREATHMAYQHSDIWLNQLIWRNFFMMILHHYPHVANSAFKPMYDRIPWENDERKFKAWCEGKTGFPIVDAGMRELNATGYMHNRARLITASFLTKLLLIDWRWGEAYFAEKLLDYELASNNGNWQWASGSGCDAAPYFRIFNPALQTQRFDPHHRYIQKWVPEYQDPSYPEPIIDYKEARVHALEVFKSACNP